jgi:hypothetical protein
MHTPLHTPYASDRHRIIWPGISLANTTVLHAPAVNIATSSRPYEWPSNSTVSLSLACMAADLHPAIH